MRGSPITGSSEAENCVFNHSNKEILSETMVYLSLFGEINVRVDSSH